MVNKQYYFKCNSEQLKKTLDEFDEDRIEKEKNIDFYIEREKNSVKVNFSYNKTADINGRQVDIKYDFLHFDGQIIEEKNKCNIEGRLKLPRELVMFVIVFFGVYMYILGTIFLSAIESEGLDFAVMFIPFLIGFLVIIILYLSHKRKLYRKIEKIMDYLDRYSGWNY